MPMNVQPDLFPDRLYMKRVDATRNMHRFYTMTVQRDLFGGANLIREWGRIGSSGTLSITSHSDEGKAINALSDIAYAKQKRGYRLSYADAMPGAPSEH